MIKTQEMTQISLFIVLYIIGSKITLPLGIIPFTLQTCIVCLSGCFLNPKQILISYTVYLGMGLIGLPVFASGGGFPYLLKPSCGFLLAFPIAAAFISKCRQARASTNIYTLFLICLIGLLIIYVIGTAYMYLLMNECLGITMNMQAVVAAGVVPFIISDTISCFLACTCAERMYPTLHSFLETKKKLTKQS